MAADAIAENPELGESKSGDLAGVRSYNIYYKGVNYELAYTVVREGDETVVVIMAGSRENFYEALKKYWL